MIEGAGGRSEEPETIAFAHTLLQREYPKSIKPGLNISIKLRAFNKQL